MKYLKEKFGINIYARLGLVVTWVPLFFIVSIFFSNHGSVILEKFGAPEISVKAIFLTLGQVVLVPFNRLIGINYERWILGGEENSCVLNKLMGRGNKMSKKQVQKMRKKTKVDFGDRLPSKEELAVLDEKEARGMLVPIARNIINSMKDNKLVKRYRDDYVESRKLVSASISAIILSVGLCVYSGYVGDYLLFIISVGLTYFYLAYLFMNMSLLKFYGGQYAKTLLEQYILDEPESKSN